MIKMFGSGNPLYSIKINHSKKYEVYNVADGIGLFFCYSEQEAQMYKEMYAKIYKPQKFKVRLKQEQ